MARKVLKDFVCFYHKALSGMVNPTEDLDWSIAIGFDYIFFMISCGSWVHTKCASFMSSVGTHHPRFLSNLTISAPLLPSPTYTR